MTPRLEGIESGSDSVIVQEARSVKTLPDRVGEDVRSVLWKWGEEEVAIVIEIAEVIERE